MDAALAEALRDARLFPADLDVPRGNVHLLRIDEGVIERSVFLDSRIDAPLASSIAIPVERVAAAVSGQAPPTSFLFHTSFCCSTLLARILHVPPSVVALKEPMALRRMADSRLDGVDIASWAAVVLPLLSRPWANGGRVLIKPTHAALNIAREILAAAPDAPGIVLYGSLEDFLVSNSKKPPDTQAKVPQLVDRALSASSYVQRLPREAFEPRSFHQLVALQWCAQFAVVRELFGSLEGTRLVALRESDLLADLEGVSRRAAAHLKLPLDDAQVSARVRDAGSEHAKAPGVRYGADKRAEEAKLVRSMFGRDIDEALRFAERHLVPALGSVELPRAL